MTREEIIEQVNTLLAEEFEIEQTDFAPDDMLKEALQLDSINLIDLVALVHYTYKITIPATDLPSIKTFNDLYDYIEQHLPARQDSSSDYTKIFVTIRQSAGCRWFHYLCFWATSQQVSISKRILTS